MADKVVLSLWHFPSFVVTNELVGVTHYHDSHLREKEFGLSSLRLGRRAIIPNEKTAAILAEKSDFVKLTKVLLLAIILRSFFQFFL